MYASGVCNWFITGLVVYELSVVFMQLKYPLELFEEHGLSPIWVCRRYNIHRRRYTSVVVDIHRLYVTKGDVKHNQLNLSEVFAHLGGGGGAPHKNMHFIPKYIKPAPYESHCHSPVSPTCIKHPFPHYIVRTYSCSISVQSLNWADDSSNKLFETKSKMCKHLETKERALALRY